MEEHYLNKIADYLLANSRLAFKGHKRTILRHRLENRITELRLSGLESYWNYLRCNKCELDSLYDLVTTNETSFFRNPAQFAFLHERIIPGFEQLPAMEKNSLRILCAGCSTGEEPYSVAMTLLDSLRYPDSWKLQIVAGDLSETCLKFAAAGYYENDKLRRLPGGYRQKYLEEADNGAVVKDSVKSIVRFIPLNLNDLMKVDSTFCCLDAERFDIIFCRNVMIYFSPTCQQLLIDTLHRLLLPGGYLFTGDAEPLHLFKHEFRQVEDADCLIYQRNGEHSK